MNLRLVGKRDLPPSTGEIGTQPSRRLIERILSEQDEEILHAIDVHVTHNYYINRIYVKDVIDADYVFSNLLPSMREEKIEVSDDEILQVAHIHLTRLNSDLMRLHQRLEERLERIEAMRETVNG
jgi:hypothetical protein